jgi:hypothetical protein
MADRDDQQSESGEAASMDRTTDREAWSDRERPSPERIARRAYERFQTRGGAHGQDQDDWLEAERDLADRPGDDSRD